VHHAVNGARATSGSRSISTDQIQVHFVHWTVTRDMPITSNDTAACVHRGQISGKAVAGEFWRMRQRQLQAKLSEAAWPTRSQAVSERKSSACIVTAMSR